MLPHISPILQGRGCPKIRRLLAITLTTTKSASTDFVFAKLVDYFSRNCNFGIKKINLQTIYTAKVTNGKPQFTYSENYLNGVVQES